jgi:hypothetical protein
MRNISLVRKVTASIPFFTVCMRQGSRVIGRLALKMARRPVTEDRRFPCRFAKRDTALAIEWL